MVTASQQSQIWHRMNTSLLGDTVQIGFTMSDAQMRALVVASDPKNITGITLGTTTVITVISGFSINELVRIDGIVGTTQLNYNVNVGNVYLIIAATPTQITIDVNSSAFTAYTSGGTVTVVDANNQFAEIELHGFILDCSPSMVLA
jgi:ribosomal protein L31